MAIAKKDPAILKIFLDEGISNLSKLEKRWARLRENPGELSGPGGAESTADFAQLMQNFKGSAQGMGFNELVAFIRELQELFDFLTQKGPQAVVQSGEFFPQAIEALRSWLKALEQDAEHVADVSAIRAQILQINPSAKVEKSVKPAAKPVAKPLGEILVEQNVATPEQVDKAVKIQERKIGEVMVEEGMVSQDAVNKALASQKLDSKKAGEQIRVPAARIDSLLKIVGELSIHQSIIWHSRQTGVLHSKAAQNAILLSNKIIKEVQTQVMSLRLQPVKSMFQRLERVARDVALSQNKDITTSAEGAEVDLDKAVIEKITDPLIHIIRNAVDHGIEGPDARTAQGKPATATVRISAIQDTNDVVIRVADDGRGMDPKRILAKAVEKGFVAQGVQLRNSDIYNLIFLPGFSTADQVTEFSGRGVGMDVVNRVITELGGSIQIQSEVGKGTTFSINIPTSVSLIDAVVFTVDSLRYVVPMRELQEVVDLRSFSREVHGHKGQMINLRGDVVPVERLHTYLPRQDAVQAAPVVGADAAMTNGGQSTLATENRRMPALLVRTEEGMIAFEVDTIVGQQQIVVRGLSEHLSNIPGFVASTVLGDGEPGMIVGLASMARNYFQKVRAKEAKL